MCTAEFQPHHPPTKCSGCVLRGIFNPAYSHAATESVQLLLLAESALALRIFKMITTPTSTRIIKQQMTTASPVLIFRDVLLSGSSRLLVLVVLVGLVGRVAVVIAVVVLGGVWHAPLPERQSRGPTHYFPFSFGIASTAVLRWLARWHTDAGVQASSVSLQSTCTHRRSSRG